MAVIYFCTRVNLPFIYYYELYFKLSLAVEQQDNEMPGIVRLQSWRGDLLNKNKYPKVQDYIFLFDA